MLSAARPVSLSLAGAREPPPTPPLGALSQFKNLGPEQRRGRGLHAGDERGKNVQVQIRTDLGVMKLRDEGLIFG